ncbi:MAG: hypothetical protein LBN97_08730 [Oscillospiraceae bacterium]|jgi:hypothetical protein|nr:hypothetical protein [Oscillospiraceae bacterium]
METRKKYPNLTNDDIHEMRLEDDRIFANMTWEERSKYTHAIAQPLIEEIARLRKIYLANQQAQTAELVNN